MREAILIHMGQAGAQIGNACWESPWPEFVQPKLCNVSMFATAIAYSAAD